RERRPDDALRHGGSRHVGSRSPPQGVEAQLGDQTQVQGPPRPTTGTARPTLADVVGAPKSVSTHFGEGAVSPLVTLRPCPRPLFASCTAGTSRPAPAPCGTPATRSW